MKQFLFPFFYTLFLLNTAFAQADLSGFMTPRDILSGNGSSNITLRNNRSSDATIYGLYVYQYAYLNPGETCDDAIPIFSSNVTAGAVVNPTIIQAGKSITLGSNFLYNMILGAIYYEGIIIPSSPPGCALPGCTWGSDTTKYNWCIYLGALAPVSNTLTYTSKVPPSTQASAGVGYDYNLISSFVNLGPISCSDQTLSCKVATPQTQSFS